MYCDFKLDLRPKPSSLFNNRMQNIPTIIKRTIVTDLDIVRVFLESLFEDRLISQEEFRSLLTNYAQVFVTIEPFYQPCFRDFFSKLVNEPEVYLEDHLLILLPEFTVDDIMKRLRSELV